MKNSRSSANVAVTQTTGQLVYATTSTRLYKEKNKTLFNENEFDITILLSDNKNVIEQAAVIKALNKNNIENLNIGKEIAKYLQIRLNSISDPFQKRWKVKHENKTLALLQLHLDWGILELNPSDLHSKLGLILLYYYQTLHQTYMH